MKEIICGMLALIFVAGMAFVLLAIAVSCTLGDWTEEEKEQTELEKVFGPKGGRD